MLESHLGVYFKNIWDKIPPYYNLKFLIYNIRICGTWPPTNGHKKAYVVWSIFILSLTLGHLLFVQTAFIFAGWSDTEKMASAVALLINNYVHAFKVSVILRHQKRIQRLLDYAEAKKFTCDDSRTLTKLQYQFSWAGFMHYANFQMLGFVTCTAWSLSSALNDLNDENDRALPMNAWYPYDKLASPFYEITCVLQAVSIHICCLHNISIDGLIVGFMAVVGCEFEILKTRIEEIGNDVQQSETTEYLAMNILMQKDVDDRLYKELMLCVEHHLAIIEYTKEFETIFQFAIFLQFLDNCCVICVTAFALSQLTEYNLKTSLGNLMYLGAIIYQLFMYCYFGSSVSDQSESVTIAAYTGNWWRCGERYKRGLRLLMARANCSVQLKAGNLLILSLPTFLTILRASYSFFTVLKSSTDKIQI